VDLRRKAVPMLSLPEGNPWAVQHGGRPTSAARAGQAQACSTVSVSAGTLSRFQ
jgi:hypothetical protein